MRGAIAAGMPLLQAVIRAPVGAGLPGNGTERRRFAAEGRSYRWLSVHL